jgi:hypothetical protein
VAGGARAEVRVGALLAVRPGSGVTVIVLLAGGCRGLVLGLAVPLVLGVPVGGVLLVAVAVVLGRSRWGWESLAVTGALLATTRGDRTPLREGCLPGNSVAVPAATAATISSTHSGKGGVVEGGCGELV